MNYLNMEVKDSHKNVQRFLKKYHPPIVLEATWPSISDSLCFRKSDLVVYLQTKYGSAIRYNQFYWLDLYDWENDCPTNEFLLTLAAKRI